MTERIQSHNFQLLEMRWPELYNHATLAERYIHDDPATAVIKLRCFIEALVGTLYRDLQLPSEPGDGLFEKLQSEHFKSVVESPIRQKLHAIRCHGNKAAHGNAIDSEQALQLIKEAYLLGRWLFATHSEHPENSYPDYQIPPETAAVDAGLSVENECLAQQLEQAKYELEQIQAAEQEAQAQIFALNLSLDEARLAMFRNASALASNSFELEEENTRSLLSIEDVFAEYRLTDGQADLVKQLDEFLSSRTENAFLLRGYAGTGKTFIIKGLTEYFRSIGRNYMLAAPTGKAAKVIAEKTRSKASTLHRAIYSFKDIAEYRDDDLAGSETYKFYAQLAVNEFSTDTVYIVDEASMVTDIYSEAEFFRFGSGFLLRDFLKYVNLDHNDHHKKVIFIGDNAQLPPVGMNFSPALDAQYLFKEHNVRSTGFELTEVVRQKADSGVIANAIMLRKAIKNNIFNQLQVDFQAPDVASVDYADFMDRYLESCGGKVNGESIVIAYSNADVAAYNRRIREHFFPDCSTITAGDKVMAVTNSSAYQFFISNGDFGFVKEVLGDEEQRTITIRRKNHDSGKVENTVITLTFRNVKIGFRNLDGIAYFFDAKILEDLLYSDQPALSSDENKALYQDFCIRHPHLPKGSLEFKETLMTDPYFTALRLKFGYAITCHKAQGSEWNNVFVKCKTNQNQLTAGYFRWFYTAITRTARRLWLLDPPSKKIGSGLKSIQNPGIGMQRTSPQDETQTPDHGKDKLNDDKVPYEDFAQTREQDTFGIPQSAAFLLGILRRVREILANHNIAIEGIIHHQYQEVYTFRKGDDFARIDIGYNAKDKITRITAPITSELSAAIQNALSVLVGVPVASAGAVAPETYSFDEDFLNDFHHRVVQLAAEQGIVVQNVVRHPWSLRYTFCRGSEVAVYDIFFDGKNRFTKCQSLVTACTPGQLVGEVEIMLIQGLNA